MKNIKKIGVWEVLTTAAAASNVQRYFDSAEPWSAWAWFIVVSGFLIIAVYTLRAWLANQVLQ